MIVSESEAAEMRCSNNPAFVCAGTGCMAWRPLAGLNALDVDGDDLGYCGMAGKPAVVVVWERVRSK